MGRHGLRNIGQGRSHTRTQHTWAPVIRSIPMGGASCRLGWPYAPYVRRERSLCVLPGARAGHVRAVKAGLFRQRPLNLSHWWEYTLSEELHGDPHTNDHAFLYSTLSLFLPQNSALTS